MYVPLLKCDFSGILVVAVPSEGCLGQRVLERLIYHEKSLQHVGSFDDETIEPMVGIVDGRLVSSVELFWSGARQLGAIQIRSPPLNKAKFARRFDEWFRTSGFTRLVLVTGVTCSFPLPGVLIKTDCLENPSIPRMEGKMFNESVRHAGFSKAWLKLNNDVEIILSSSIFDLEPLLEGICSLVNIEYKSIMSLEDLHLTPPPDGIY